MLKFGWLLITGVVVTVVVYAAALLYFTWPISEFSIAQSGVFGDSFGLLTSLFSGLAFAGLIITILMQKEELALQRDELLLTRKELSGQRKELAIQNTTMIHQNFENTFFRMLSLHNDIVKEMDLAKGGKIIKGRDVFKKLHEYLMSSSIGQKLYSSGLAEIDTNYMEYYIGRQHEIGHYFRNLYNIVKFVHESPVQNKKLYTNIVRAQLSSYELFFLFYNCLSQMGSEKFKPLIEEYSLLKTLLENLICNLATHKRFYAEKAYI